MSDDGSDVIDSIQVVLGASGPRMMLLLKRLQDLPEGSEQKHEALGALYMYLAKLEWRDAENVRQREARRIKQRQYEANTKKNRVKQDDSA